MTEAPTRSAVSHWLFGDLYEAIVFWPKRVLDSAAQLDRMHALVARTSPTAYFVTVLFAKDYRAHSDVELHARCALEPPQRGPHGLSAATAFYLFAAFRRLDRACERRRFV
jgi:hypothetical protein